MKTMKSPLLSTSSGNRCNKIDDSPSQIHVRKIRFSLTHWFIIIMQGFIALAVVFNIIMSSNYVPVLLSVEYYENKSLTIGHSKKDDENSTFATLILQNKSAWPPPLLPTFPENGRLRFLPGTLKLSQTEAFQFCHVDEQVYRKQFDVEWSGHRLVAISEKYKFLYFHVPKSGSSTARWVMKNNFEANERKYLMKDFVGDFVDNIKQNHGELSGYEKITFVRDPLSRFLSGYEEMVHRTGPWSKSFKNHPFPFIHEGMTNYKDYSDIYCPPTHSSNECNATHENGTLSSRFERFVREYDGLSPFDQHLRLQTTHLWLINLRKPWSPLPIDTMYNTSMAKAEWASIAANRNVSLKTKGQYHARSNFRRLNVSNIKSDTWKRICQFVALDYCCLNFPLPSQCVGVVFCAVQQRYDDSAGKKRAVIEPWLHPN